MLGLSGDLDSMAKCPVCEKKYKKENAIFLENGEQKNTIHFTCENCRISSLIFLSIGQAGFSGVGVLTDLDASEVGKFFQQKAVSSDQVLEVYDFFRKL